MYTYTRTYHSHGSPEKIRELKHELELERRNTVRGNNANGNESTTGNMNGGMGGGTSYVFTIGSIDSFERSLHHHQTVANTPLNAWVPVR